MNQVEKSGLLLRHAEPDGRPLSGFIIVGQPLFHQFCGMLAINIKTLALPPYFAVGFKPEPSQRFQDFIFKFRRRTFPVGVLDAENKPALLVARVEKVEKGGSNTADMKVSGWGWRKSNADHKDLLIFRTQPVGPEGLYQTPCGDRVFGNFSCRKL